MLSWVLIEFACLALIYSILHLTTDLDCLTHLAIWIWIQISGPVPPLLFVFLGQSPTLSNLRSLVGLRLLLGRQARSGLHVLWEKCIFPMPIYDVT